MPAAAAAEDLRAPGLTNEAGEYNCFLNVIIQCLWRCADFRTAALAWPPAVVGRDPVVGALQQLLRDIDGESAASRRAVAAAGGGGGGAALLPARGSVNPSRLREALADLPSAQISVRTGVEDGSLLAAAAAAAAAAAGAPPGPAGRAGHCASLSEPAAGVASRQS